MGSAQKRTGSIQDPISIQKLLPRRGGTCAGDKEDLARRLQEGFPEATSTGPAETHREGDTQSKSG